MRSFLLLPLLALAAFAHASDAPRYETRADHDPNGTGRFYMGREIAQVMGPGGIPWLERPEREADGRSWALGFWTAYNAVNEANHTVGLNARTEDIFDEVKKVCVSEPSLGLVDAGILGGEVQAEALQQAGAVTRGGGEDQGAGSRIGAHKNNDL